MDSPTTPWAIYTLSHPDTGAVRYVGKAEKPSRRLWKHLAEAPGSALWSARWICTLLEEGKRPVMNVVETGVGSLWKEAEQRWIDHFKAAGAELTNIAPGGGGGSGPASPATRAKISKALKGLVHSPEWIEKVAAAKCGQPRSSAAIEAQRQKMLGHSVSVETRAKISKTHTGRKQSPAHIAKLTVTRKGRKHTEATRAKMSESHKGLKPSAENLSKRSASVKATMARKKAEKEVVAERAAPPLPVPQP